MRTNLSVSGCNSSELIQLKNVLAVPNLPGLQESILSAKDSQHYPYLSDIKFVELDCWDIDLLIGADVQAAHHVYEARYGEEGQPTAILTGLGWTLSGPDSYLDTTTARQVNWTRRQVEFDVHEQFDRLYNCEFRDLKYLEKTSPSVEDLKALDQMRQSVKRVHGRYEVGLPWRSESVDLPYNRKVAESRLSGLRKRLMKELAAAVTAVKLSVAVCQELEYKFNRVRFWTDSTSVIQYIANESKRLKTYVANRLAVIREHSKLSQWRYVNTDANPADLFSLGVMPASYKKSETWLKGPDFLLEDDVKWPASPVPLQPLDNDPEVKQDVRSHATSTVHNCFDVLFARFSVFFKMLSVVAWMLRFMSNLPKRLCGKESDQINTVPRLCNAEMESATLAVVKVLQRSSFPELYNNLCASVNASSSKSNRVVSKQFGKLHPFMDDGIIRVGGRLQRSNLPFDCRDQILLPSNHLVTDFIVNHYHCLTGHSGTLHVLSNIRTKFWIVKGHATVKRVLRNCRKCRLWKAEVGEQLMSPLPVCRVTPSACVFQHVGLDYFGPITIKQGRNNLKRYACVFSCMSTRALHIEIAFALDTSSFMNVFCRFCGRRGFPSDIYSDNGSNFIGAEREMREAVCRLNCDVVHAAFLRKGMNWHFNPPAASHQGGIWERMIRTIRKVLRMLTGGRNLSEDQLATFMVEVERIVNDRPLTPVSSDTGDLNTLSPSALLLGRLDALLAPDEFIKTDGYRRSWRSTQYLVNQFWQQWLAEYMPLLQQRQKWLKPARNLCVGDVVLVVDRPSPRGCWPKAIVEEVFPDRDNLVRRARVRTAETTLLRDIRKLCLLEAVE